MNSDIHSSNPTSLKDFQAFLGDFLQGEDEKSLSSVKPITDGLGLESPKRVVAPSMPVTKPIPKVETPAYRVKTPRPQTISAPPPIVDEPKKITSFVTQPEAPPITVAPPPPLPGVSLLKRGSALVLDQLFVQAIWMTALVITSNVLSGFETGFSSEVLRGFSEPLFFRFAILEFATIWLAYLAISLGIFNMTFGMWVWDIRISYGNKKDENYGLRKLMRILWSFIFFAPILPLALLVFRKQDRNLLDVLSGSNLYLVQN